MLEIKKDSFSRKVGPNSWNFSDRNVDDVKDGYVSCEPFQVKIRLELDIKT